MKKFDRQRLAKQFPTTKEELRDLVRNYQGPVTKCPTRTEKETETDRMWKLINEMKARGV
jgi:hypothetical protein